MARADEPRGARWGELALFVGVPLVGAALSVAGWIAWHALTAPLPHGGHYPF